MRWFKEDDAIIDRIVKFATLCGLIFGAWVYFHTVYPVFTKERELIEAKHEAEDLRQSTAIQRIRYVHNARQLKDQERQIDEQRTRLSQQAIHLSAASRRIDALAHYSGRLASQALELQRSLQAERAISRPLIETAVQQQLEQYRDRIVKTALDRLIADDGRAALIATRGGAESQKEALAMLNSFNLKRFVSSFVSNEQSRIAATGVTKSIQERALTILQRFANERLRQDSGFDEMSELIPFYRKSMDSGGA
jgi:hypothetical protein